MFEKNAWIIAGQNQRVTFAMWAAPAFQSRDAATRVLGHTDRDPDAVHLRHGVVDREEEEEEVVVVVGVLVQQDPRVPCP